ncbi:hypothetical protein KAR91_59870 [Candidatus Pacearchaeota archaeon]|nr:hypothetical protein [Candidatus Pacearchaeota archaeon]
MRKNVASQKLTVFAFDETDNSAKTGDAANIIAYVDKDYAGLAALADTSATEVSSTNAAGYYTFDLAQAETNADTLMFSVKSATADIGVIACPPVVATVPPYFSTQSIDSNGRTDIIKVAGTTQTANDIGADVNAILVDTGTTLDGKLNTLDTNVDAVLVDTGTTLPATLTTIEGKIDTVDGVADAILVDTGTTLPAQLDSMSGATFNTATDSLEAIRNRGDAEWITGAGGSAPTVIEIRQEMDSNSTQLTAIVADTGELQTNQGAWATATGFATSGALATVDANVDAILIDTIEIGVAGAGLTNIGTIATCTNVTNMVSANTIQISGDSTAADNLELQYDTTGLIGDTFPAYQLQVANIVASGAANNAHISSCTLTTGTLISGTCESAIALDGVYHIHEDDGGTLDLYYEFDIGTGVPSEAGFAGYLQGLNDTVKAYAYDWVTAGYIQIETIAGKATATNDTKKSVLFQDMVGTGVDEGKVRIRFYGTGLTSATFAVDRLYVAFVSTFLNANVTQISGDATAADSAELFFNDNYIVNINVKYINDVEVIGAGVVGNTWRPKP